jgi:hypothetical protein
VVDGPVSEPTPGSSSPESLRNLLARVHERLQHAEKLDPESRELLIRLVDDIERTMGPEAVHHEHPERPHPSRAEELAVRFEAEHPALARAVRQLMDLLVKAGI